jgi:hypothetical protein
MAEFALAEEPRPRFVFRWSWPIGSNVVLWYGKRRRESFLFPYHGRSGTVVRSPVGKVKNHLVDLGDRLVNVPAGNVRGLA